MHAWAFEVGPDQMVSLASNTFEMEWPPRSGRMQAFPEIDRAEFFPRPRRKKESMKRSECFWSDCARSGLIEREMLNKIVGLIAEA